MPDTHTRTQHTPGPWAISTETLDVTPVDRSSYEVMELQPITAGGFVDFAEEVAWIEVGSANARLIAAAPDLLSALERMIERYAPSECTNWNGGNPAHQEPCAACTAIRAVRKAHRTACTCNYTGTLAGELHDRFCPAAR